jgi:hypothetical protein
MVHFNILPVTTATQRDSFDFQSKRKSLDKKALSSIQAKLILGSKGFGTE